MGDIEDFTIVKPDGNEYLSGKTFGRDQQDYNKNRLSETEIQKLKQEGIIGEEFDFLQNVRQKMTDGLDNSSVYFSNQTTTDTRLSETIVVIEQHSR